MVLGLGWLSCRNPQPELEDGWAVARRALVDGRMCFAGRPEYCVTDPDFVDAAIRPRLDALYGGQMPPRKVHVEAVIRAAELEYKRNLTLPANVARIEELVRERYFNPRIELRDGEATIDVGVVPGKLEAIPATRALRMRQSDEVEAGGYRPAELSRLIALGLAQEPKPSRVSISVELPLGRELIRFTYRYDVSQRRIVVFGGGEAMSSPRLESEAPPPVPFSEYRRCLPEDPRTGPANSSAAIDRCPVPTPTLPAP